MESQALQGIKNITPEFLTAGRALFTVSGSKKHYTFKITKKNDQPYYVYMLTGSDNTRDYAYLGCFIPNTKTNDYLKITAKSRCNLATESVKVFKWAVNIVLRNFKVPTGYTIAHAGKCATCGRQLTEPTSIKRGFGPHCFAVLHANIK